MEKEFEGCDQNPTNGIVTLTTSAFGRQRRKNMINPRGLRGLSHLLLGWVIWENTESTHIGMTIGLSRPVPSRPAAGSSSGCTRLDRSARDAVLKLAAQSRTAKCVGLRGLSRRTSQKNMMLAASSCFCFYGWWFYRWLAASASRGPSEQQWRTGPDVLMCYCLNIEPLLQLNHHTLEMWIEIII